MEPIAMTLIATASEPSPLEARAHAIKNCVSVILGLASTIERHVDPMARPRVTQLVDSSRQLRDLLVGRRGRHDGDNLAAGNSGGIEEDMKTIYTAVATVHGGREGHVKSDDGVLDLDLRIPKSMGGPGGAGSNPEQLFAAGYAACFESALRLVARQQKKALKDARITAHVSLIADDAGHYGLGVELRGQIEGVSTEETRALMQAAHEVCPYSNATRGNIEVKLVTE